MLDPKRRVDFGGWAVLEGVPAFRREWPRQHARAIARPALGEDERAWCDAICRIVYHTGGTALAADELPAGVTADRTVPWLDVCLARGREHLVTTYVATQRPSDIPMRIKSEAEHLFVFDLNLPGDRAAVASIIGPYTPARVKHGFVYWTPLTDARECRPLDI